MCANISKFQPRTNNSFSYIHGQTLYYYYMDTARYLLYHCFAALGKGAVRA